jgi:dTDP-4-dehydrorhamnose reductase
MPAPLVWITGAGGLIGSYFVRTAPQFAPKWKVRELTRSDLDLLDFDAVRRLFRTESPQLLVHCAALAHTPSCEKDPELARKLNVDVTAVLAELAAEIPLVFFSTDLVFDGRTGNYDESSPVNPLNVYAKTKLEAERILLVNPRHLVLRSALNGGTSPTGDRGFNEQLRRQFQRGETLKLFIDEFRCPIPAVVTAQAVWELVAQKRAGLFHLTGSERLSRWQMGRLIAARWPQLHPKIERETVKNYSGPPRPADVSLNCAKVQKHLSFHLPGLSEWLAAHPEEIF